jgi:hypothetical protein
MALSLYLLGGEEDTLQRDRYGGVENNPDSYLSYSRANYIEAFYDLSEYLQTNSRKVPSEKTLISIPSPVMQSFNTSAVDRLLNERRINQT